MLSLVLLRTWGTRVSSFCRPPYTRLHHWSLSISGVSFIIRLLSVSTVSIILYSQGLHARPLALLFLQAKVSSFIMDLNAFPDDVLVEIIKQCRTQVMEASIEDHHHRPYSRHVKGYSASGAEHIASLSLVSRRFHALAENILICEFVQTSPRSLFQFLGRVLAAPDLRKYVRSIRVWDCTFDQITKREDLAALKQHEQELSMMFKSILLIDLSNSLCEDYKFWRAGFHHVISALLYFLPRLDTLEVVNPDHAFRGALSTAVELHEQGGDSAWATCKLQDISIIYTHYSPIVSMSFVS
jgi:hypothetical protein